MTIHDLAARQYRCEPYRQRNCLMLIASAAAGLVLAIAFIGGL